MNLKRCSRCKEYKELSFFRNDSARKDGKSVRCKVCSNKMNQEWRKKTGFYRTDRYHEKTAPRRTYASRKEILAAYNLRNPEKIKARRALNREVKKGNITRLPCEECGEMESQAHHYLGYEEINWLKVKWLCQYCHTKETYE